jgi:hypothetical protein
MHIEFSLSIPGSSERHGPLMGDGSPRSTGECNFGQIVVREQGDSPIIKIVARWRLPAFQHASDRHHVRALRRSQCDAQVAP